MSSNNKERRERKVIIGKGNVAELEDKHFQGIREEFDELFPKDQEAIDGIRPSKSNRSAALVLYSLMLSASRKMSDESYTLGRNEGVDENTSDGYHTFKELYEFRKIYNAALFNEWSKLDLYEVHKSKKHNDGLDCFGGGWFIVMATLPTGQISNHYELKDWDLFQCEERELADKWDGHTAQDVVKRLASLQALKK